MRKIKAHLLHCVFLTRATCSALQHILMNVIFTFLSKNDGGLNLRLQLDVAPLCVCGVGGVWRGWVYGRLVGLMKLILNLSNLVCGQ